MTVKGATESPTFYCGLFLNFIPGIFNSCFFPFLSKAFSKLFLYEKASCKDGLGAERDLSISTSKCRKLHLWAVELLFRFLLSYWQNNYSVCKMCIIRCYNGHSEVLLWRFRSTSMRMLESGDTWCSLCFPFLLRTITALSVAVKVYWHRLSYFKDDGIYLTCLWLRGAYDC